MKIYRAITTILTIVGLTLAVASAPRAEEGFYVGGAFGKAYLDETIDSIRIDTNSNTYRVFGGYGFTPYFGVEVSYLDLGTFRDTIDVGGVDVPVSVSADGFTFAGVGTLPLGGRFSAIGRFGFFFHDGESTAAGFTEQDPSEANPFVGLGLAFSVSEAIDVNVGVDYLDTSDADPLFATVGLTLRF